jgi:hypothetical protein
MRPGMLPDQLRLSISSALVDYRVTDDKQSIEDLAGLSGQLRLESRLSRADAIYNRPVGRAIPFGPEILSLRRLPIHELQAPADRHPADGYSHMNLR